MRERERVRERGTQRGRESQRGREREVLFSPNAWRPLDLLDLSESGSLIMSTPTLDELSDVYKKGIKSKSSGVKAYFTIFLLLLLNDLLCSKLHCQKVLI